ncbi:retrotransposon-related protein [Trifolium pratense]|uniref:Retrotransposon-related protein n=1 Tax=Trifolium pratense TaxID=57577 RepID=A0A2K3PLW6_TRIPR|nr:retrotransposon-related protein [Trifolium pratense]
MGQSLEDRTTSFQSLISPATMVEGCCWSSSIEVTGGDKKGPTQPQNSELLLLLDQFAVTLAEIQGLPPNHNTSHSIELMPGAGPVNFRPYQYPHHQKDEIE